MTNARESYLSDPVLFDNVRERLGSQKVIQKLVRIRSVIRERAAGLLEEDENQDGCSDLRAHCISYQSCR